MELEKQKKEEPLKILRLFSHLFFYMSRPERVEVQRSIRLSCGA